jgi:uncharacterized membrane protein (UPF0127 family)
MDKKFAFQIFGLLIVTFAAMIYTFNPGFLGGSAKKTPVPSPTVAETQPNNLLTISDGQNSGSVKTQVNIEIADTKEKRTQGLSGRQSLPANAGMLFLMEMESKPTFWMKGMLIPLDFIWILDNKVVDVLQNVPPPEPDQQDSTLPRYSPVTQVNRVLEVNAGFIAKNGIKVGDTIQLGPSSQ